MTDPQVILDLFGHRRDVYAVQQTQGMYLPVHAELDEDVLAEHLAGFSSVGGYTTRPDDQTVRFVCWDLDIHDEEAFDQLRRLVTKLVLDTGHMDYSCLMAEFSGNKGKHIWLFLDKPIEARLVRRWIARDFTPAWTELAREKGWPVALEVFPKQDEVPENGFGNLVKVPFGVHQVSQKKSAFIPIQGWAESVKDVCKFDSSLIPVVSDDELGTKLTRLERSSVDAEGGPLSPFPCVDQILYKGVGKGVRDNAMFHIALYLYGHAVPADLALEICHRSNEHFDPPLTTREVEAKVKTAYSGRYASARCGTDWLTEICPGPCRNGWGVANVQQNALKNAQPGTGVEVEITRVVKDEGVTRITVSHPDADNTPTLRVKNV